VAAGVVGAAAVGVWAPAGRATSEAAASEAAPPRNERRVWVTAGILGAARQEIKPIGDLGRNPK
jgi:hypothetical protein